MDYSASSISRGGVRLPAAHANTLHARVKNLQTSLLEVVKSKPDEPLGNLVYNMIRNLAQELQAEDPGNKAAQMVLGHAGNQPLRVLDGFLMAAELLSKWEATGLTLG